MKVSQFPISTLRETPAEAELSSHQLMLKAGLIRQLASGLYTWGPYGLRVLKRVENIVREEMDKAGAVEMLMPTVQPAELWQESGRWEEYGKELLRITDRHQRDFCYGPTHEEIITDYARNVINSYKELPINFYQIQWKFRDEVRPRFGLMRSREFLMKDAYSFHLGQESLQKTYDTMHQAYSAVFTRLGLQFRAVEADNGSIGGSGSHEFHVLADSGEDAIAYCPDSDYAANIETAETKPSGVNESASEALTKVATTGSKTVDEGAQSMGIAADRIVKTIIVQASEECDADFVALLLRGNQKLNEIKTEKQAEVASPLSFANEEQILALTGATPGSLGPKGLNCPIIADYALQGLADLAIGANETGYHYTGASDGRDFTVTRYADLRNIEAGDPSPCGQGTIDIVRGIEVGHIFQLGTKYSEALKCQVLNENGKAETVTMGCYGIGVSRIVAASIEQQHDDNGIIWPDNIAPFQISIAPLNYHKAEAVKEKADALYAELKAAGVDVLMDDRNIRPGAMFADHDLLGIPHRIVISDRGLGNGELEYKARAADEAENIAVDDALALITSKL